MLKPSPGTSQRTKLEFLEFRKKNHSGQLRFHSTVRWGLEGFPSHFTDLLRARLSTSITSTIFKEKCNSCLIALCNTSWQCLIKREVEIGCFLEDHCHYFTHQFSLMNCVIQPQETLLEEQFSQRKLLWKQLLTGFFWIWQFPWHETPFSTLLQTHAWVLFTLYFHHLSVRRIKILLEVLCLKHSPTKMNIWGKPEALLQSSSLSFMVNLTCNSWQIFKKTPCFTKALGSRSTSWADADFHFDILTVVWPHQGLVLYVSFELALRQLFPSETELGLLLALGGPTNSQPWDRTLCPSLGPFYKEGSKTDDSDTLGEVLQSNMHGTLLLGSNVSEHYSVYGAL